jgi:hypothetical protein
VWPCTGPRRNCADLGLHDEADAALRQAVNHPRIFDCADPFNGATGVGLAAPALFVKTQDKRYLDYSVWCADEILARAEAREIWSVLAGVGSQGVLRTRPRRHDFTREGEGLQ